MVERSSPFSQDPKGETEHVSLGTRPRGALWQVAAWPETFSQVESDLAAACGCEVPGPGQAVPFGDGCLLIRTEPLKWWVMGPEGMDCPLTPDAETGAWLDMGHDQVSVTVTGASSDELLKRMVSIDLRDAAFPNLSFATTHMHHMITKVLRRDQGDVRSYEVMVMRSYADDLREIAEHHFHQFG